MMPGYFRATLSPLFISMPLTLLIAITERRRYLLLRLPGSLRRWPLLKAGHYS